DAMSAPQVPTGRAIGQAVLDHEPHRQSADAVGRVTARGGQSSEVSVEVLATCRTGGRRIGAEQVAGTPGVEVAALRQRALLALMALGLGPTTRPGGVDGRRDSCTESVAGGAPEGRECLPRDRADRWPGPGIPGASMATRVEPAR